MSCERETIQLQAVRKEFDQCCPTMYVDHVPKRETGLKYCFPCFCCVI